MVICIESHEMAFLLLKERYHSFDHLDRDDNYLVKKLHQMKILLNLNISYYQYSEAQKRLRHKREYH